MSYLAIKDEDLITNPKKSLLPFQEKVVKETLNFLSTTATHAAYNACEQGLGKTVMAIATLKCIFYAQDRYVNPNLDKNVLIICPAVMRFTWAEELITWDASCPEMAVITSGKQLSELKNSPLVIISYDLAAKEENLFILKGRNWDLMICDEAHYVNLKSRRTSAVLKHLFPKCTYKLFLSGTPCRSNVVDLFNISHKILPSQFPAFESFAERYSYRKLISIPGGRKIPKYFGVKNAEELSKIIRQNFFIRRTKAEVMPELPPKRFSTIYLGPEYLVEPDEKAIAESYLFEAEIKTKGSSSPVNFGSLALQRREQGIKKTPAIIDFVTNLLEQGIPIVIFAWHRKVISLLETGLARFSPLVITGDTPARVRDQHVTSFQAGKSLLFIGNILAAGTGITLTASSTVVFAELSWVPAEIAQAIDRTHRIGQEYPVDIHTFLVKNSIDERISRTLLSKANAIEKIV